MLAELKLVPIGTKSASVSADLVEVATLIEQSGLDYRLGPMGTVVEGEWDQIVSLARQCHQAILRKADRVMTTIHIDDRTDVPQTGRMAQKVASLDAKVGRPLKH